MKEKLPINLEILKWSRISLGLSIEDVALKLKKPVETIIEWEEGISSPSYPQLEKLAYSVFKRPIALFFFPKVPEEDTPKTSFRTLPETILDNLLPEIILLHRKAKMLQLNLKELYEDQKPFANNLIDFINIEKISDISSITPNIRTELSYSIEEQFKWQSTNIAFKKWRKSFENNGIFIFKDAFSNDQYSGFCIFDKKYPIIFINNSIPFSRQIFTLFHELGHLLLHVGGIDFKDHSIIEKFENKFSNFEIICNRFANDFLVPNNYFKFEKLKVSEQQFEILANKYSVSREVILRNYLNAGLITNTYYDKMAAKWIDEYKQGKKKATGGQYYYTQKAYLGDTYIELAFSKYYQNKITIENLSELLNIKVKNISTFEHYAFS